MLLSERPPSPFFSFSGNAAVSRCSLFEKPLFGLDEHPARRRLCEGDLSFLSGFSSVQQKAYYLTGCLIDFFERMILELLLLSCEGTPQSRSFPLRPFGAQRAGFLLLPLTLPDADLSSPFRLKRNFPLCQDGPSHRRKISASFGRTRSTFTKDAPPLGELSSFLTLQTTLPPPTRNEVSFTRFDPRDGKTTSFGLRRTPFPFLTIPPITQQVGSVFFFLEGTELSRMSRPLLSNIHPPPPRLERS